MLRSCTRWGLARGLVEFTLGRGCSNKAQPRATAAVGKFSFAGDISPGSVVVVSLPGVPANVTVGAGHLTSVTVDASWPAAAVAAAGLEPFAFSRRDSGFALSASAAVAGLEGASVAASIPPRFCSVEIVTDGAVSVDTVVEGSLSVSAGRGVSVGRSRGGDLRVRARGPVRISEAAAQTDVDSGGGDVVVTRLAGRDVRIVTGGGSAQLGAVFCERLFLDTRGPSGAGSGGSVTIGSLRVEERAEIDTGGGDLVLWGLDGGSSGSGGSASGVSADMVSAVTAGSHTAIRSRGGSVRVQMHERADGLDVSSEGGAVALQVPETFSRSVSVSAASCRGPPSSFWGSMSGVLDLAAGAVGAAPPPQRIQGGSADPAAALMAVPLTGRVTVSAGRGSVEVSRLSWMERTLQKLRENAQLSRNEVGDEGHK